MDSALKQISDGVKAVFKGCSMFFAAPPLWPLALIPFTLVLICCGFIVWGGLEFSDWITEDFRHAAAEWPHWLNWIPGTAGVLLDILIILLMIALFIFCSGALYETLGGVFFDRIVEKLFAGECGTLTICRNSWQFELKGIFDSVIYSLGTLLLTLLTLWLYLLPPVGPVVCAILLGYRMGVFYIALGALRFGRSFELSKELAGRHKLRVLGYGLAVYVIYLVPLAPLLLLPGIIIGGILLQKECLEPVRSTDDANR